MAYVAYVKFTVRGQGQGEKHLKEAGGTSGAVGTRAEGKITRPASQEQQRDVF